MRPSIDLPRTAARLKADLPVREVFTYYGYPPDMRGFVRCPFHDERTASLKVFTEDDPGRWKCFGCGAGGTSIDFVMRLYGLTFSQAVLRMCSDFGLDPDTAAPLLTRRREIREREAARRREAEHMAALEAERRELAEERRYWWEARKYFAPNGPGDLHPLFSEALKRLPVLDQRLDRIEEGMKR